MFDEDVTGWKGAHQAFQVREFADDGLGCFAAVNMPPSVIAMSIPHRGRQLGQLMAHYNQMVLAGLLCEDTTTGQVRTIAGRPQAFYQLAKRDAAGDRARPRAALGAALRGRREQILMPFHGRRARLARRGAPHARPPDPRERLGGRDRAHDGHRAHGRRPRRGGDRRHGFVHDADRLMVSDATLFPTPIRVNPMETIMALATRSAGYVIDNARRLLS